MKIKYAMFCIFFLIYCPCLYGGGSEYEYEHLPNFEVPEAFYSEPDCHPAVYLILYPISNTKKNLTTEEKKSLAYLFIEAASACVKKYNQDYNISTSTPIYLLLKNNFQEVSSLEGEFGEIIFLRDISKKLKEIGFVKNDD